MPRFRLMWSASLLCMSLCLLAAQPAWAHFVFVVSQNEEGSQGRIVFSETLEPDDEVDVLFISKGLTFHLRDMTGKVSELTLGDKTRNTIPLALPGKGTRVVYGEVDLGVMERRESKPHILIYHPKSIIGDAFDVAATILNHPKAELIAVGKPGAVQFQYNILGKPAGQTQVTVVLPDGQEKRVVTDDHGRTPAFDQAGSYGVWGRYWEETPGQRDGKKYEQVRHYATLVVNIPAP